jgi:Spy/CpxP family protein refolding chaperone
MDIFVQRKLLIRLAILLTVLNLGLIGYLLTKDSLRKTPPREIQSETPDVSRILKRELNLTNEQIERLRSLRKSFGDQEKTISSSIKTERDSINMLMFNKNTNEVLIIALARRVGENDYKMEMLRFNQAQAFKDICTPEQMEKFEGLIREIRDFFKGENQQQKNNENPRPGNKENRPPRNNENRPPRNNENPR